MRLLKLLLLFLLVVLFVYYFGSHTREAGGAAWITQGITQIGLSADYADYADYGDSFIKRDHNNPCLIVV